LRIRTIRAAAAVGALDRHHRISASWRRRSTAVRRPAALGSSTSTGWGRYQCWVAAPPRFWDFGGAVYARRPSAESDELRTVVAEAAR
jgi:hypothetical protein